MSIIVNLNREISDLQRRITAELREKQLRAAEPGAPNPPKKPAGSSASNSPKDSAKLSTSAENTLRQNSYDFAKQRMDLANETKTSHQRHTESTLNSRKHPEHLAKNNLAILWTLLGFAILVTIFSLIIFKV